MIYVFAKPIPSFMWCMSFPSLCGDVLFYIVALCIDNNVYTQFLLALQKHFRAPTNFFEMHDPNYDDLKVLESLALMILHDTRQHVTTVVVEYTSLNIIFSVIRKFMSQQ